MLIINAKATWMRFKTKLQQTKIKNSQFYANIKAYSAENKLKAYQDKRALKDISKLHNAGLPFPSFLLLLFHRPTLPRPHG